MPGSLFCMQFRPVEKLVAAYKDSASDEVNDHGT
ncbi:hypothetical protein AciPR4_2213 [Terriglobus saanensis SP1PR4]|uniref:Uncharacterized protein n=1 Tax=Terriglobus saanensis (strain ATCC BAA-1853 / DSM 23119 / SP1PR4) TaxID=401053 RepID=E8UX52_TERSS|nr:hypothetical protein AciPR4_2213 [Terriglobus saanensis SP1PR4]